MTITLEVPDDVVRALRLPEGEQKERLLLELACSLYARHLLSCGKATQLSGLNRFQFSEALSQRKIARHYNDEDLATDAAYAGL